jgi:hypothetical protein
MHSKSILALLLVSGAFITPAHANFFHNPYTGINLNIGSAPNPTPQDIREDRLPIVVKDDQNSGTTAADANKEGKTATEPVAQTTASQGASTAAIQTAAQAR